MGAPSTDIVSNTEELSNLDRLSVYPNPVDEELTIEFSAQTNEKVQIVIQDISGKSHQQQEIKGMAGSNLVIMNTADLAAGTYFATIRIGQQSKVVQFVKK